jgi:hypothetical protein
LDFDYAVVGFLAKAVALVDPEAEFECERGGA